MPIYDESTVDFANSRVSLPNEDDTRIRKTGTRLGEKIRYAGAGQSAD